MNRCLMLACALTLAGPTALKAQEGEESPIPAAGSWAVTTNLPDGGGQIFGLWRRFGERINLGLEVDFRHTRTEDDVSAPQLGADVINIDSRVVVGPTLKYYLTHEGPVVAFLRSTVARSVRDIEVQSPEGDVIERDTNDKAWIVRAAVGADYFPVERVAVGFWTGVVLVKTDLDVQVVNAGTVTRDSSQWNTFTSGIELQYFF